MDPSEAEQSRAERRCTVEEQILEAVHTVHGI